MLQPESLDWRHPSLLALVLLACQADPDPISTARLAKLHCDRIFQCWSKEARGMFRDESTCRAKTRAEVEGFKTDDVDAKCVRALLNSFACEGLLACDDETGCGQEQEAVGDACPSSICLAGAKDTACTSCLNQNCCGERSLCALGSDCARLDVCMSGCSNATCKSACEDAASPGALDRFETLDKCRRSECARECSAVPSAPPSRDAGLDASLDPATLCALSPGWCEGGLRPLPVLDAGPKDAGYDSGFNLCAIPGICSDGGSTFSLDAGVKDAGLRLDAGYQCLVPALCVVDGGITFLFDSGVRDAGPRQVTR